MHTHIHRSRARSQWPPPDSSHGAPGGAPRSPVRSPRHGVGSPPSPFGIAPGQWIGGALETLYGGESAAMDALAATTVCAGSPSPCGSRPLSGRDKGCDKGCECHSDAHGPPTATAASLPMSVSTAAVEGAADGGAYCGAGGGGGAEGGGGGVAKASGEPLSPSAAQRCGDLWGSSPGCCFTRRPQSRGGEMGGSHAGMAMRPATVYEPGPRAKAIARGDRAVILHLPRPQTSDGIGGSHRSRSEQVSQYVRDHFEGTL